MKQKNNSVEELEIRLEKLLEELKELKSKEKDYLSAIEDKNIGKALETEKGYLFVNKSGDVMRIVKEGGFDNFYVEQLPEKKEIEFLEQNIEKAFPFVFVNNGVSTKDKAKEIIKQVLENRKILKRIEEVIAEIEKVEATIRRLETRERNKQKREFLKGIGNKCMSCNDNLKIVDYVIPEKQIALCSNCYKKPEYLHLFKNVINVNIAKNLVCKDEEESKKFNKLITFGVISCPYISAETYKNIYQLMKEVENYLYTKELMQMLKEYGVKQSWIKEMEEAGIITPIKTVPIKIEGRIIDAKIWDKRQIDEEKIRNFVKEKTIKVTQAKIEGREKAKKRLKEIHETVRKEKERIKELIEAAKTYHPFLETAFYLFHANHYAKTPKYKEYSNYLYKLKEDILLKAYEEYPDLVNVYFIERGDKIIYCEDCKDEAYMEWNSNYYWEYDFGDFLRSKIIKPCDDCIVEEDYYSLVEFDIDTPIIRFNFHIPYSNVSHIFDKEELEKIKMNEEDVYIKFGRSIEKYESLIVPLKTVIKKLESYLEGNNLKEDGLLKTH